MEWKEEERRKGVCGCPFVHFLVCVCEREREGEKERGNGRVEVRRQREQLKSNIIAMHRRQFSLVLYIVVHIFSC